MPKDCRTSLRNRETPAQDLVVSIAQARDESEIGRPAARIRLIQRLL